jgi:hypothetical protein
MQSVSRRAIETSAEPWTARSADLSRRQPGVARTGCGRAEGAVADDGVVQKGCHGERPGPVRRIAAGGLTAELAIGLRDGLRHRHAAGHLL